MKRVRDCNELELAIRAETIDERVRERGYALHHEILYFQGIVREMTRKEYVTTTFYRKRQEESYR